MLTREKIDSTQNRMTLAFDNTHMERSFHSDHARQTLSQVRRALIIAALFYGLFSIIDFIVIPDGQWATLMVRFTLAIPTFVLGYIATFRPYFKKRLQMLVAIVIFIAGLGVALIALLYENTRSDLYLAGTLLPVFWAFIYSGLRFVNAVKVSLVLFLTFNILFFSFSTLSLAVLVTYNFFLIASIVIGMLGGYTIERYYRRDFVNKKLLQLEKRENEKLLLNILPKHIADELKSNSGTIAKDYDQITVLFTDLVGFSALSKNHSAQEIVTMLNEIFSLFDGLTDKYELEKIKTIGDAYMVTSNLRNPDNESVLRVADFALEIKTVIDQYNKDAGQSIQLRTGIHTGSAVAGVIGVKKFVYDVWGNTVNVASRMESECPVGKIQVSQDTYQLLADKFTLEERGFIQVKGFGEMRTYILLN
ncbi:MAG: hypothetical protein OEX07_09715 [Gammaproteobacteria bacterium]|nr:hypothetical protein [Gammaproteobacteria bacterium]